MRARIAALRRIGGHHPSSEGSRFHEPSRESRHHRRRRPDRLSAGLPHCLRPAPGARPTRHPPAARDSARARRPAGRGNGARRLRLPSADGHRRHGSAGSGLRRRGLRAAGGREAARPGNGAQGSADGEREDFLCAGEGAECARRAQGQGARRGQPRQHQRPHCAVQCARSRSGALHGDDAPRPQPRAGPAGREDGRRGARRPAHDDLGQPLRDAVPRREACDRRRPARAVTGGRGLGAGPVHSDGSAARRRHHQGARRVFGCLRGLVGHRPRA